ncbi:serine carboxypeptidase 1-like [Elaeis guineensis]|uniref:Carboxypeptidase n=2 Tax=Elaeis guineensis var. tenera TaxID=51953 RepID=A0A6J0PNB0_ELAGV|nr:putative serine carboxypeptidase-like 23 isoform X1 [Elaeis guineensis]
MMFASLFTWIIFSYFLFLPNCTEAKQANLLHDFIRSNRPSSARFDGFLHLLNGSEALPPIYVAPQNGLKELDKIDALPGQPKGVNFDQYAGYVMVEPQHGRTLFYYFVESPRDPERKPLLLWLNGGPGCSSLGGGAMQELGPFRVQSDGKTLHRNKHAWNNVANVVFLESPAGVGFSYTKTSSDYENRGDKRTAEDTYTFLVNWLERFPEYKTRDFFVTGESYAGHYVPQLASLIVLNNKKPNKPTINLRGIAIGNAYIDTNTTLMGMYEFLWMHAMYSDRTYRLIRRKCKISDMYSSECENATNLADFEIGSIDRFNVYVPLCTKKLHQPTSVTSSNVEFDPCAGNYVYAYLNLPEVQKSLHAIPFLWTYCSRGGWRDSPYTMLPMIKQLATSGIRMWLYSGDMDSVVSVTSTKYFLRMLGLPIKSPWRPWQANSEVAGYVVAYNGLTFVTVRGAGHEVPSYQPERSLIMISAFLEGKLPPA